MCIKQKYNQIPVLCSTVWLAACATMLHAVTSSNMNTLLVQCNISRDSDTANTAVMKVDTNDDYDIDNTAVTEVETIGETEDTANTVAGIYSVQSVLADNRIWWQ